MNWVELLQFKAACEAANIAVPTAITRGLELIEVAKLQEAAPSSSLLDLSDDAVTGRITDLSIRAHEGANAESRGLSAGVRQFEAQVLQEVREASLPDLDRLIAELRPTFEELAKPLVTAAQKYGFTLATTSDYVVDLADEKASKAWRDARQAWHAILPTVRLRILMSEAFAVSPTRDETNRMFFTAGVYDPAIIARSSSKLDYSVCFASGDNWAYDGLAYSISGKGGSGLDWFALAAGGLTLNTPAQVREKQELKAVMAPRVPTVAKEDTKPLPNSAMMLPRYDKAS